MKKSKGPVKIYTCTGCIYKRKLKSSRHYYHCKADVKERMLEPVGRVFIVPEWCPFFLPKLRKEKLEKINENLED